MNLRLSGRDRHALVTGGGGFLGSHVCERLLADGAQVTCLDDLSSGSIDNLEGFLGRPEFRFVKGDVRSDIPRLAYTEIWNLASPASPPRYQTDPVGTLMINVVGTKAVLDVALACGARVLQASTSEVYGDPEVHPQVESYNGSVNTTGPRACYDEGKRAAEALCFDYRRLHGLDVRVARIFNTYGPRMDPLDGRVVTNFIVSGLSGRPLELKGGGRQTRSFCYCEDLVEGLARLMRHPSVDQPVNIGNPHEVTVEELARQISELLGVEARFAVTDMPADDPRQRCPDIGWARANLGWQPSVSLREGLERTIAYFRERGGSPLTAGGPRRAAAM
ncbi:MAG: UDP-glucuronic acid decarboxylase family protein [Mesorhizobium sp.]